MGYDDEGNTFSSLEGLEFEWKVIKGSELITVTHVEDA
jgi:hypothetical protein